MINNKTIIKILLYCYNKLAFSIARERGIFWSLFTKRMGRGVLIFGNCTMQSPQNMEIGDYVSINRNSTIGGHGGVIIGNFVKIGPYCTIITANHQYSDWRKPIWFQDVRLGPVRIGDDVWIGTNVVILPNVKIGRGSIIGAGAVVTHDVDPYTVVGGVPAKFIKYRFSEKDIKSANKLDLSKFAR